MNIELFVSLIAFLLLICLLRIWSGKKPKDVVIDEPVDMFTNSKPIYAIHPGFVTSTSDGQTHYINAGTLAMLYKLRPNEWVEWKDLEKEHADILWDNYIHLYPSEEGLYGRPQ